MAGDENMIGSGKDELSELRYMQQVYQNQYSMVSNSINVVLRELQELGAAQKTLENMELVNGREVLTGIGGDFYISGSISSADNVLVGIGAGYVIEKDIDSAKAHAEELIKKHTEGLNRLTKSRKEIENALVEISYRMGSR